MSSAPSDAMRSVPECWESAETAWQELDLMALQSQGSPRCPSCGAKDTRRSKRRGFFDWLLSLLGFFPYRCEACTRRFLKWNYDAARERRTRL